MKYTSYFRFLAVLFLCAALLPAPQPAHAEKATLSLVVNGTSDGNDALLGDGHCDSSLMVPGDQCSLRAAIQESNARAGAEEITFLTNYTIQPDSELPALGDTIGIVGGGHTIILDGTNVILKPGDTGAGLTLGSYDYVQGITIRNFEWGILSAGDHNLVGSDGDGASDTQERNTIISNANTGVQFVGDYNHIAGNDIGINLSSTTLGNGLNGVLVDGIGNIIGADGSNDAYNANERNVISSNGRHGIHLISTGPEGNTIAGNYIGTSTSGNLERGNKEAGIYIASTGSPANIYIGTNGDGIADDVEGNVISGNKINGITLFAGSSGIKISGNKIGTNAAGSAAIANNGYGIYVKGPAYVLIGTNGDAVSDTLEGNLISGNTDGGIYITTSHNTVAGNKIGTNAAGTAAISNQADGITIDGSVTSAGDNTVGMSAAGHTGLLNEKNLISGNEGYGVYILGESADDNFIAGNYIGMNISGDASIYNSLSGVCISGGGDENVIGSNLDGTYDVFERNYISGNFTNGIEISSSSDSTGTRIVNNYIGTSAEEWEAVPNGGDGIQMFDGMVANIEGNVIGWNGSAGMDLRYVTNSAARHNYIGITPDGDSIPNTGDGIYFGASTANLTISDNSISYNGQAGIYLGVTAGTGIYYASGNSFRSNGGLGIDLYNTGVNANDNLDADSGPNNLQNYPVLTGVTWVSSSTIHITGSFNSLASQLFVIHVYGSSACDPSGYGEGGEYMGSFTVTTGGSGNATIDKNFSSDGNWVGNPFITLLAVDVNTTSASEFSQCAALTVERFYLPMVMR